MKKYDVAIIGGGLAGLIAAIELAEAGKSVALLEKSSRVGGRAITVNKSGALFNLGGHALYLGGEANRVFREYGLKLTGNKPSTKGLAIWRNELFPMPGDPMALLSSRLLGWSGKAKLLSTIVKINKTNADEIAAISLRSWAESAINDPMVRHIFYALCRTATYTQDPDFQLAGPVLKQVKSSLKEGVMYLDGGWQTIVDQLRDRAIQKGVDILINKSAAEIQHERRAVSGVLCTDGTLLEVSSVISTASPAVTYQITKDAESTSLRRWKDEVRPAVAASLDLALKRLPAADRNFAIGLDQPVFFSNHSRAAKLSDNGTIVVHLTKYNGPGQHDPKSDEKLLEQTMSLLHPDWEREVVARQYLPNITVVNDYPHLGRTQSAIGPAVPEIEGLYVAGDWVSHGELLADASAASAIRAAYHIVKAANGRGVRLLPATASVL
ncbi:phytoene desaturase family protein [Cohnella silvisoli]|uniref:FAD-dependent oxidoreductase n=1 Tax=Cohnella silvisoli TaxID=2873699 RepID=A0ABV1KLV0_9BACL|nr:FAD-dependent oxidoreductase [Cohnella silvisoli]MCD9020866.1 FAD-dependent oxidoreductase [Cohnella silvisoli]